MKALVCGGRDYHDKWFLFEFLDAIHLETPITTVIHGDYSGADRLAGEWANANGIECIPVPAQWTELGKKAGPIRNQKMLDMNPDVVIAFPGHNGTADMCSKARRKGVKIIHGVV